MSKKRWKWVEVSPQWRQLSADAWIAGVKVGNKPICLVKKGETVSAVSGKCPHQGAPLAAGSLNEAGWIVCPWHRISFDPATGDGSSGGYFLESYPTEFRGNTLYIATPIPWWSWS